jgi:GH15 family glucan-1,4-alpha-glucosidase
VCGTCVVLPATGGSDKTIPESSSSGIHISLKRISYPIRHTSLQPNDRALDVRWRETDNIYDIIKYHEETIRQWKNLMRRCDAIKKDPITVIDVT